ncbi:MAG: hypothetical protein LCH26_08375, partial [Proteobacteria bacterium]|nr:hypothetical protein [Pseudomonadota bacterium]
EMWRLSLEKEEFAFLGELFSGKTVGDALETLPSDFPQEKVSLWFSRWISNSLLAFEEQAMMMRQKENAA